jgi:hypothetical protein
MELGSPHPDVSTVQVLNYFCCPQRVNENKLWMTAGSCKYSVQLLPIAEGNAQCNALIVEIALNSHGPPSCETLRLAVVVCVFITAVPITKLFDRGEGDSGGHVEGHVLRETTSRGLCGLVCPSHTSERWREGDCVKEGEGDHERERALGLLLCHIPRH